MPPFLAKGGGLLPAPRMVVSSAFRTARASFAESAGTSGQMLKEGTAINLSLTALGSCIKALSENKRPNFRDSKLTLLLMASMTSGKVIMIAALSPAEYVLDPGDGRGRVNLIPKSSLGNTSRRRWRRL